MTAENKITGLGSIALDLFQLSLMDKNKLQSQLLISNIMYNLLMGSAKTGNLGSQFLSINKKLNTLTEEVFNINIKDIFNILIDKKGNPNLFSKFLRIFDLYVIKSEFQDQSTQTTIKFLTLPFPIQFMLLTSLTIYLYGDMYLGLYVSDVSLICEQAEIFIDTVSWIEDFFTNSENLYFPKEITEFEINLIKDISNYWKDLYRELFSECQKYYVKFSSEKSDFLQNEVIKQLNSDCQILILTERKTEAYLICRLINKLMKSNFNIYLGSEISDSNYTSFGVSCISKSIINKEIDAFTKKIAQKNSNLDINISLYLILSEFIVNEQVIINKKDTYLKSLTDFQQEKTRLIVSNTCNPVFFQQKNISVIIYSEEKHKSIVFSPPVIINKIKIICIRDQKEETLRKIRKIDRNMKENYNIKKNPIFQNAFREGKIYSEYFHMFNFTRMDNSIVRVNWFSTICFFQSIVLCNLNNNYQKTNFSIKYMGVKDYKASYKVVIQLDETVVEENIYISNKCLLSSIIPYILEIISKMRINSNPVIEGASVLETTYAANKKKTESTLNKTEEKRKEARKDDGYGGQQMPTIDYEFTMNTYDNYFRQGSVAIYVEEPSSSDVKSKKQQWGVISDTKLFNNKRIKTEMPVWEYFDDRKNNKKFKKGIRIFRLTQTGILCTDHYKFLNIFMIYEMYKARNLFIYQFLCKSISSACEVRYYDCRKDAEKSSKSDKVPHSQKIIDDFGDFFDLVRDFVNSK